MCVHALSTSPLTKQLFAKAIMQSGGGIHMIEYISLQEAEKQGIVFFNKFNKATLKNSEELRQDRIAFRPNIDGVIICRQIY